MKKWLLLPIVLFILVLTAAAFGLDAYVSSVTTPTNGTEYYSACPFTINVTSNTTGNYTINYTFDEGVGTNLINLTATLNYNKSAVCFAPLADTAPAAGAGWRDMDLSVNDSEGILWYNNTVFQINERTPNTVNFTFYNLTNSSYVHNQDILATFSPVITLNESMTSCTGYIDDANAFTMSNVVGHTRWVNSSVLTKISPKVNGIHNIKYKCLDAYGNVSWSNATALPVSKSLLYFIVPDAPNNATAITITHGIANGTEYYSRVLPQIWVSTNYSQSNCHLWIDNVLVNNLTSASSTNWTSWTNSTVTNQVNSTVGQNGWHNLDVNCSDSWGNMSWSNVTNELKFQINERAPQGIAITAYTNVTRLINGTEYYRKDIWPVITLNETATSCTGYYNALGGYANKTFAMSYNGTYYNYSNSSALTIAPGPLPLQVGYVAEGYRIMTFKCLDAYGNQSWYNTSAVDPIGWLYFKVNEWPSNSVGFTENYLTNKSTYTALAGLNFTTNKTATSCKLYVNNVLNITLGNQTMDGTNDNGRKNWKNTSAFRLDDGLTNIQYYCTDAFGNFSWYNGTTIYMDTTVPVILSTYSVQTIENNTDGTGNIMNFTYNVTDTSPAGNYITIYLPNSTFANTTVNKTGWSPAWDGVATSKLVYANVTSADLPIDGEYIIEFHALDTVGKKETTAYNSSTYIVTQLKANLWNPVTVWQNSTTKGIASLVTNVSYVSLWNQTTKSFLTYQVGLATSENSTTAAGDGVFIKTTGNNATSTWFIRNRTTSTNAYMETENISLTALSSANGGWNLFSWGVKISLNESFYVPNASIQNVTASANGKYGATGNINLTYVAFYNTSYATGAMCSVRRNFLSTSCPGMLSNTTYVLSDKPMWILTQANMTINRTIARG